MALDTRCISQRPDLLGESPVWDCDNGCLYWVDGVSRLVKRYVPATGGYREWSTPSIVGSVALGLSNTLVVALTDGIYSLCLDTGEFTQLFRPDRW